MVNNPSLSAKWTITSHLKSLNIKISRHMTLEIQILSLNRRKHYFICSDIRSAGAIAASSTTIGLCDFMNDITECNEIRHKSRKCHHRIRWKILRCHNVGTVSTLVLQSPPWLGWPLWNICVTNYHGYVLLVVSTSRSFPHSRIITGFVTRFTRRVSLVEQYNTKANIFNRYKSL